MKLDNKQNYNLQVALTKAKEEFKATNPAEVSAKSRCDFDAEKKIFYVPFLNNKIAVSYPTGSSFFINTEQPIPLRWQILILHYLIKASGTQLTENFISYKELPGGYIYFDVFQRRVCLPLVKEFGEIPEALMQISRHFSSFEKDMGDYSFTINALPQIPITFILWCGDEEFSPNATILFNEKAEDYLATEDYAFLSGLIVYELIKLKQIYLSGGEQDS